MIVLGLLPIIIKSSLTDKLKLVLAIAPLPSSAVIVIIEIPIAVGVPVMMVLALSNIRPSGRLETLIVKVSPLGSLNVLAGIMKLNRFLSEIIWFAIEFATVGVVFTIVSR